MNEGRGGASKCLRCELSATIASPAVDDEEDPVRVPDKVEPRKDGRRRASGCHGDIFGFCYSSNLRSPESHQGPTCKKEKERFSATFAAPR